MELSVVILNYNVRYFLEQCVLSVQKAVLNLDAEIIVVDNNSSDGSCAMIKTRFPNVILVENHKNSGFPKGNNIGVAIAKGAYICILNPDTVVAEDTFEKTLAFAKSKVNPGVIGVRLIDGAGNFLPESKRGVPTPFTAFTKIAGLYKLSPTAFGKYYASHLKEDESGEVEILVGAFMLMQREVYLEVGGFDENCFMYSDDIDLSYMIMKTGRKNYYFHETTVIHYKGESTVRDGLYMKRFREAMDFFYRKHFRTSLFFDIFMKSGTFIFSKVKKEQAVLLRYVADRHILISDNALLLEIAGKAIGHQIIIKPINFDVPEIDGLTQIIFDNALLANKEIIQAMSVRKNKKTTFRIIPDGSDFIIGSDSSNGRGEVIRLN